MTALQLLSRLRSLGGRIWIEKGNLRVQAPPGTLTADLQQALAQHKEEILSLLERAKAVSRHDAAASIQPASRDAELPLSFAQQRLWFLQELNPDSSVYNVRLHSRLTGSLNVWAMRQSLDEIVRRHESLRTTFSTIDGKPIQVIAPPQQTPQPLVDLRELAADVGECEAARLARQTAHRPFDLRKGPLLRSALVQLGAEDHVWLLDMHHIVTDGWSMGVFSREFTALYGCFSKGKRSPLPELRVQYADFAVWQRQQLRGEFLERQLSYWQEQLKGAPALLELPTDRPRKAASHHDGRAKHFSLSQQLKDRLVQLSRHMRGTLFMTLLAAFQVLLARYSGQSDLVVGSPIAGRNQPEIEGLIGFFVNTLVLRGNVSGDPTFRQFLAQVRQTAFDAYAHQYLPFEHLVAQLQLERDLGYSPLIQVMFALQNAPREDMRLPGVAVAAMPSSTETAKFDLTVQLFETPSGISGSFSYDSDLFDASTIEGMIGHFEVLLEGIMADPDRRISALPLLTDAERHQLLVDWNETATQYPNETCIHELFEEQVERTPEAVAAVLEEAQITYRELNIKANQLAHYLRSFGVGPESLVGICLERSLEMIVGLLGVLKAGGAYVPLDPTYPRERLVFMIQDTAMSVLVTHSNLSDQHSAFSIQPEDSRTPNDARRTTHDGSDLSPLTAQPSTLPSQRSPLPSLRFLVYLDLDAEAIAQQCSDNLIVEQESVNLAYVIYTSGSTGKPKGIGIPHSAISRLFFNTNYIHLGPNNRVAQAANASFDAAIFEIWGALLHGGQVVGIGKETLLSPEDFSAELNRQAIDTLFLTTTLFNQMANAVPNAFESVEHLLFGGEAADATFVRKIFAAAAAPHRLLNVYGPTESTTFATWYEVIALEKSAVTVAIGRPLANTQVRLLDRYGALIPAGVTGELHIGGRGLARGYFHRPDLTAEKFGPDAYADTPGQRLYRTGDLGRYQKEGSIEFLGRIDRQVKIRGFRVEPDEIGAVLAQHPAVREAVVVASQHPMSKTQCLVAYVASRGETVSLRRELRSFLAGRLPYYMMPQLFMFLDKLPLTANRKVDRSALPYPEDLRPDLEQDYRNPRNGTEELLANIWADILGFERVGINDNFFELGGHSLLATQVISRVRAAFGVEVPLRALFEAPTIEGLAERVDKGLGNETSVHPKPIVRAPRDRDLPLSFAQQRLWFLYHFESNNAVYNVPQARRLAGKLDLCALAQCVRELVRRHESLRTTFPDRQGRPVQRITSSVQSPLHTVDLASLPASLREREARTLLTAEASRPFDLAQGPVFRVLLVGLADEEHLLLTSMHHIVSDGWSMGVMMREVGLLYDAFSQGRPSPLPELSVQYADFAVWQRGWLAGEILQQQLDYWERQLEGIPELLELPADRPRPAVQTYRGSSESLALSRELSRKIQVLSRRESATLFMTLLAAFQVLLMRYTGQPDIVVGSPIAGRTRPEIEGLIGFFINTLVMRGNLSGNPTFREFLAQVRQTALDAYAHQDVPFEYLVEQLQPERNLSHSPLFQVMFIVQNAPRETVRLTGITMEAMSIDTGTAKFDLTLSFTETSTGLRGAFSYNTDLFDTAPIRRMVGHFETLLEGIVTDPDRAVAELPLLTDAERHQLLVDWNETAAQCPNETCIHELFEVQVERTPEAVAAVFEEAQITYRELNIRANQLAHYLRSFGVGPESLVGICLERSLEMIVGLLGVLKAGGAYVPLDPTYPRERLVFMIQDTAMSVLITRSSIQHSAFSIQLEESRTPNDARRMTHDGSDLSPLPSHRFQAPSIVCLDLDAEAIGEQCSANPVDMTDTQNTAYVIYTSGSTGTPKGVVVSHRNVVRLFAATDSWYQFASTDVWTLFHSYAFDFAVWEIWGALLYGGRLVVVSHEVSRSPGEFSHLLARHQATVLNQTPSAFAQLNEEMQTRHSVRLVIFGGEALDFHSLRPWFEYHGDSFPQLVNMYGITETTVHVTYRPLIAADTAHGSSLIGQRIPDLTLYLLDRCQRLLPVGVPAEIHVGGAGVVHGYLDRPELTAERFLPDSFAAEAGSRLYRSGDLARHLADGDIEYLGRIDHQVKIRGFRIELGEIESVLTQYPGIRQAVVVAQPQRSNREESRLVSYIVLEQEVSPNVTELRRFLTAKLPDYMVPAEFAILDEVPLTPTGKLDRKALPEVEAARPELEQTYIPPRSQTEELLAGIWEEVLGLEGVGIHDNFFELGGHSLLATQVVSRVRQAFAIEIPVRALFLNPTIADLAHQIDAAEKIRTGLEATPIVRVPRDQDLMLSFAQEREWLLDRLEPGTSAYNLRYAMRIGGRLRCAALRRSLTEMVERHESLRTVFPSLNDLPVQVIQPVPELTLPVADLSSLPHTSREVEMRRLVETEARTPFELSRGPLFRCLLIRLDHEEHALSITMHHIVSDGWSMGVFSRELWALYQAFIRGEPSPLPKLDLQYADYAQWQRHRLTGSILKTLVSYWKNQLFDTPTLLELPTDHPRPRLQRFQGAHLAFSLMDSTTENIKVFCQHEGATPFMTLLSVFNALLYSHTAQERINVGTFIASRNRTEIEPLIGFFINTLVLSTNVAGEPSFRALVSRVRTVTLDAYAHQDLPFEKLLEELKPARNPGYSPLFQVMFVMQNTPGMAAPPPGLTLTPLGSQGQRANFDLTLWMWETQKGFHGSMEYNTDLFEDATVKNLVDEYHTLTDQLLQRPDTPLSENPLIQRLLSVYNDPFLL